MSDETTDKIRPDGGAANAPSFFDQLGGEESVRRIVGDFMDRVFADRMIGFFFRNADKDRVKAMEYELAAEFLGGPVRYRGKPLAAAHAKHPIMGGHFARRRQLLKETLESYCVPEPIKRAWLEHTDALRRLVTPQAGSSCDPIPASSRGT